MPKLLEKIGWKAVRTGGLVRTQLESGQFHVMVSDLTIQPVDGVSIQLRKTPMLRVARNMCILSVQSDIKISRLLLKNVSITTPYPSTVLQLMNIGTTLTVLSGGMKETGVAFSLD